jgi:hypothetical protein
MKDFREFIITENRRIIQESYEDYLIAEDHHKEVFARQIRLTALGDVRNFPILLNEWLEKFKNEELVLNELKKI